MDSQPVLWLDSVGFVPWLALKTPLGQNAWSVLKQKYCCILRLQSHLISNNSGIFCVLLSHFSPWDPLKQLALNLFLRLQKLKHWNSPWLPHRVLREGSQVSVSPLSYEGFQTFRLKGNCSKKEDTWCLQKLQLKTPCKNLMSKKPLSETPVKVLTSNT